MPVYQKVVGQRTLDDALEQVEPAAEARLRPLFDAAHVGYPPREITLIGLKEKKRVELWARERQDGVWIHIRDYDVLGASGGLGPKLREGDMQVPEGMYQVIGLNPNSAFHLSMKLNYPNRFDLDRAAEDGRHEPGTDIFIHGSTSSIGCVAIGDEGIEDLFVLAARTGLDHVQVILAPRDFRRGADVPKDGLPPWAGRLYEQIKTALNPFNAT